MLIEYEHVKRVYDNDYENIEIDVPDSFNAIFNEGAQNTEQQVQPDNGGMCTRPDMVDCHAKVGTGGRCMNVVTCPPLQVN